MSELRSTIDSLSSEVLPELPDARIEEDFSELQRACELLEVERLRRLAEIDRRGIYERDGHLSAASWLAKTHKVGWGAAREQVRVARALEEMPETRRALRDGELSLSGVRVLVGARDADPKMFIRSEHELVEAARIHSVQDLGRVTAFWRQRVERDRSLEGEERLRAQRRLHASVSFLGMVRVDGDLDPETGETLMTALGAVLDSEARSREKEDHRSPAQRRADALGEICRQWLDSTERPNVGGERPHVTVTVDADALAKESSAELDYVGPVPSQVARRVACDASVMRVVMAGRSEPLDVGRRTSVISAPMRRAVIVRDRHCRFPGCDRPHTWCDAHHVVHWADGGQT
ncbi:MAG: HNH endonuclease, partial [Actinomycetota bacterium]|nr:HNH endonuclease [Actinomycetota bacterium]